MPERVVLACVKVMEEGSVVMSRLVTSWHEKAQGGAKRMVEENAVPPRVVQEPQLEQGCAKRMVGESGVARRAAKRQLCA